MLLAVPAAFAYAEGVASDSYVQTYIFSSAESGGYAESHVETSGDSEVHVRTVISGEVVEDVHTNSSGKVEQLNELSRDGALFLPGVIKAETLLEGSEFGVSKKNDLPVSFLEQLHMPEGFFLDSATTIFSLKNDREPRMWAESIVNAINDFIIKLF